MISMNKRFFLLLALALSILSQTCQSDQFLDEDGCKPCKDFIFNCIQCQMSTVCTSCVEGYYVNDDYECSQQLQQQPEQEPEQEPEEQSEQPEQQPEQEPEQEPEQQPEQQPEQLPCNVIGCKSCPNDPNKCEVCDEENNWNEIEENAEITCGCSDGYFLKGNECILCGDQQVLEGCITCSDDKTCTGCDIGHYLNEEKLCQKCSQGCIECSNIDNCTQCNIASNWILSSQNTCICQQNTFLIDSSCISCTTLLPGCLLCSSPTSCTSCHSGYTLSILNTSNTLNTSVSPCQRCSSTFPGCSRCQTGICLSCNNTGNFQPNGTLCKCKTSYYLEPMTLSCVSCLIWDPHCLACSSAKCEVCSSGYVTRSLRCEKICNIPGCLFCHNETVCAYCGPYMEIAMDKSTCDCIMGEIKEDKEGNEEQDENEDEDEDDEDYVIQQKKCRTCPEHCTDCQSGKCQQCEDYYLITDDFLCVKEYQGNISLKLVLCLVVGLGLII